MRMMGVVLAGLVLAGCRSAEPESSPAASEVAGTPLSVQAVEVDAVLHAAGVAAPLLDATLSTRLMGTVLAVHVQEGDRVRRGQPLLRIDVRDLSARRVQVDAGVAEAEAVRREAQLHAERMRRLLADDAAPQAQVDAAETALARAEAAVRTARAAGAELDAVADYGVVRAPFDGVVVARMVDPGAFAAPGAPLLRLEDPSTLRVTVSAAPEAVRGSARGGEIAARIGGVPAVARVEGIVPAQGGHLYTVNALVANADGRFQPGSAATLALPQGRRTALMIPAAAVRREGDLTGVHVRVGEATDIRWVRLGEASGTDVEVLSGLRTGETIIVPLAAGVN